MDHNATSRPGWYPDPTAAGQLRLWDGEGWTAQTQPWNPAPAKAGRRRRMAIEGAGLGLMMLVAGFPPLPSWGSPARPTIRTTPKPTPSTHPTAAASPSTTTAPAVTVDCRQAAARPGPARVIEWFTTHGLTATASGPPALPAGACGVAAFTDAHAAGPNLVIVYPSGQAADDAAATPPPGVPPLTFVQGLYVLAVGPGLAAQRGEYETALVNYIAASNPTVVTSGGRPSRGSGRG